jgi:hypothetical protein
MSLLLPKRWSDISVEKFIEISEIDKELGAYHYNSEIFSIITDEPIEDIEDLDIEVLNDYMDQCKWALSQPSKQYKQKILGMQQKSLSKLTLFEYIDLDYYFNENYLKNIDKICAILYRQAKSNRWGEEILEPYDYDLNTRADKFLDLPITDVYGIINEFLKFRENFLNVYANLFGQVEEISEEDRRTLDPEEIKEIEQEKKESKWSWERMIYGLTNGDITKTEAVGSLPLVYVFNVIGMKKELDI